MKESTDGLASPLTSSPDRAPLEPGAGPGEGEVDELKQATVLPLYTDELQAMRAAMRLALTEQLYEKASNVAEFELAKLRSRKIPVIEDGSDIVQQILLDTFEGRLHWRHGQCPLLKHVCDTARDRVRRMRERARCEIRIDELDADHEGDRADVEHEIGRIQHHPGAEPVRDARIRELVELTNEHLWGMATAIGDANLMKALAAVVAGARGQSEVAEALGLDGPTARRVWRRLRVLAEGLPPELRDQALDLL
jgi:hypothetical protein